MSKSNIKILLFIAAVAILGLTYMYVFRENMDTAESIQAEVDSLQVRYDDLKAKEKDRDMYVAETERLNGLFQERLAYFPATLDQEISVMFIKGIEKDEGNLQFAVNSVGLGEPETFYTLGSSANTEETAAGGYQCMTAAFPIQYEGSYEGLKDFMDYIMGYKYRMNLSTINITYDSQNDIYSGNLNMNAYCITGGDREADKVDVNVPEGVDNLFLGGDGAATVSSSGHDADNGASIADKHNILVGLNNANGDSSDGIIVSAGSNRVSSTANSIETVDIKITEEDGKNQVEVALGDDSYSFELTDKELTIYVESSKRVDSDDKNGIKLNVSNNTDVAVFVKVADDDSSAPRFALGSKTGTVKVY